jgi:hypothetical protein
LYSRNPTRATENSHLPLAAAPQQYPGAGQASPHPGPAAAAANNDHKNSLETRRAQKTQKPPLESEEITIIPGSRIPPCETVTAQLER